MRNVWTVRAAAIAGIVALAGCSSVSNLLDSSSSSSPPPPNSASGSPPPASSSSSSGGGLLSGIGIGSAPQGDDAAKQQEELPCPEVTVRSGAATLLLGSKASVGEVNAMDLRYQGTLVRFARECKTTAGVMTMKIGIEGRVITGPAGTPGQVDIPLRLAVVQEGPNPKTVLSKLVHVPVTVTAETPTVDFTHIDSEVAFPVPRPLAAIESYVVYVGFDPTATAQKPPPRRRR